MNKKKVIVYVGFYDIEGNKKPRFGNIAAMRKMDYVIDTLQRAGFSLLLISPSWLNKPLSFDLGKKIVISKDAHLVLGPSIAFKGKLFLKLTKIISLAWFFCWLIRNVKMNEKVWVYHSPILSLPLRFAKKLKRFKIVLEIGEIYGDVWDISYRYKTWEKLLIDNTDYFVPASKLLAEKFGDKVFTILSGDYRFNDYTIRKNQTNINVVYAGSIDAIKSGAIIAAECAQYLPNNYVVHIAGYGSAENIKILNKRIISINHKKKRTACIFHGLLNQKELSVLLFNSDIAINPQKVGEYMDTAFPSKILTYLSHNLLVISTNLRSVKESELAKVLVLVDDNNSATFVDAIKNANLKKIETIKPLLEKMDYHFKVKLTNLFNNIKE